MRTLLTRGIILSRTDFGEADRIVTVITTDSGKLRLMVKGVRRMKSKMAGGIELFSVNQLSYIKGRGDIGTLISARSEKHYPSIIKDIDRVQLGYEFIKMLNRATEDNTESEYFETLDLSFVALDDLEIDLSLIKIWFQAQLLRLAGYTPNLLTDTHGDNLEVNNKYIFDFDEMTFSADSHGKFSSDHIKLLRITFNGNTPKVISKVQGIEKLIPNIAIAVQTMFQAHIRI